LENEPERRRLAEKHQFLASMEAESIKALKLSGTEDAASEYLQKAA
jgi:hypothetical protein